MIAVDRNVLYEQARMSTAYFLDPCYVRHAAAPVGGTVYTIAYCERRYERCRNQRVNNEGLSRKIL